MARHYSGSVGHRRAVPFQVTVLGLAAVLQRVHVLVGRVLVRAVRSVVVETADLVIGIGVRVGSCLQHVQLRLIVGSLQQIVPTSELLIVSVKTLESCHSVSMLNFLCDSNSVHANYIHNGIQH